ncbi:hypothetical protein MNBD_NITROSPINAE04-675 [hydrothermal vent metagenome]|uniref:Uncharacterized protein n=1 Tax=hydrothermal vent metagenome TaxID=652676 RepID=A0A3B1C6J0_9ZZZZ
MINAVGAGGYGSIGAARGSTATSKPAAGNSKVFPAKNNAALNSLAKSQTERFISNARQVARGASGASRVSIKA